MKTDLNSSKGAGNGKATILNQVATEKKEIAPVLLIPAKTLHTDDIKKGVNENAETKAAPELKGVQARRMTMEELTDKAEKLHLLKNKYQEIRDKRKQLENFSISHDKNNAQLTLVDAKGLSISTSNPQSIGKLLVDWMADLNAHLNKVEEDMRIQLEQACV